MYTKAVGRAQIRIKILDLYFITFATESYANKLYFLDPKVLALHAQREEEREVRPLLLNYQRKINGIVDQRLD